MDTVVIVLCIITCIISAVCCITVALLYSKIKGLSSNDRGEQELRDIRESIMNEFSRNRQEQNQSSHTQRSEMSKGIDSISKNIENLSKTNNEQLTAIYRDMFVKLNEIRDKSEESTERQNKRIEASLEKIRENNEKKLDEMRAVVDEKLTQTLSTRLDSSFKTVSDQLEKLYKSLGEMKEMSSGITENVSGLSRVLTNVKARGTWAEIQLKNILDQTIPGMYVENFAPRERSKDRVEFAIKIPSGENYSDVTYLPLDSKFPIEDYIRLCDAADRADPEALAKARRDLEERVLHEAKTITKYINVPKTTPFAIMYLATEGLYAEIASSKSGLLEKIQRECNVMIAGPTTIIALLNSLSMGFKIAAINEKANEVRKILSAVKSQYDTFGNLLEKARRKISEAGSSLEQAQHRNNMIQKKLKSIESVSEAESNALLEMNNSLDAELGEENEQE